MSMEPGRTNPGVQQEEISVVHVDDDEELCELTAEGLEEASDRLEVAMETDPTAVTDRLSEVDCVVADYDLPRVDGLELLRRVRAVSSDLPFILYTGKGDESVASDAQRASTEAVVARRKARSAVERERSRLWVLLEYSPAVTAVLDETGEFEFLSPSIEDVIGYTPRELRGRSAFEYVHEDDLDRTERAFARVLESPGTTLSVRLRFRERGGGWRYVEVRSTNHLENPAIEGVIVNAQDVTERKRTEGRSPSELTVTVRGDSGQPVADGEHLWEVVSNASRPVHGAEWEVSLPSGEFRLTVRAAPVPDAGESAIVVAVDDIERL